MRRLAALVCGLMTAWTVCAQAQVISYDLCIENQRVEGNDYFFDVVLTNTGINTVNLGESDILFSVNTEFFCGRPNIGVFLDNDLRLLGYTADLSQFNSRRQSTVGFKLFAPFPEGDIEGEVFRVEASESKRLFQVSLNAVCNESAGADIQWSDERFFVTIVTGFSDIPPYQESNITDGGTFCVNDGPPPPPTEEETTLVLVRPNPVRDLFTVELSDRPYERFTVYVYDVGGKEIQAYFGVETNGLSEISDLLLPVETPAGTYILNIVDANNGQVGTTTFAVVR